MAAVQRGRSFAERERGLAEACKERREGGGDGKSVLESGGKVCKRAKMLTAPSIPRPSPIQVLRGPDVA